MSTTILDLAKASGFSKSTVSRAFIAPETVHPATLAKIMSAAKELNYTPNAIARAMITKRTENIGFIIYERQKPVISNPFYGPILEAIIDATSEIGYSLFIASDRDLRLPSGEIMLRKQVDGVILASYTEPDLAMNFLSKGIPIVLLNYRLPTDHICSIVSDDYNGTFNAVEYLITRGHKKIALLSGAFSQFIFSRRYDGFIDALAKHGLRPDQRFLQKVEPTLVDSMRCVTGLLSPPDRPTAIFCTNDTIAAGAVKAALRMGLSVPHDVSVIGYDNSDICTLIEPELTSVDSNKHELGVTTVDCLKRQINGQKLDSAVYTVSTNLVVRGTTN